MVDSAEQRRPVASGMDWQVFRVSTDAATLASEVTHASDRAWLDATERARADRFHDPLRGDAYARVRATLRQLLGGALPRGAPLVTEAGGKPVLGGRRGPFFNVSHTRGLSLIALSATHPIGIDVEHVGRVRDPLALAGLVCSDSERKRLGELTPVAQADAFARAWTRKEAFVKATGKGLGFGLARIHVGVDDVPAPLSVDGRYDGVAADWTVLDLPALAAGCRSALCIGLESCIRSAV